MNTYYNTVDSPIGKLTLSAGEKALKGLWMDKERDQGRVNCAQRKRAGPWGNREPGIDGETGGRGDAETAIDPNWIYDPDNAVIRETHRQLKAYFGGELKVFDIPLAAEGTPFQKCVWNELLKIPYGVTISYGELAARIGNPKGSRAVGLANGRNPISIIVPCHRVIGANGKLVGYGGGLERKMWLLELEQSSKGLEF